MYFLQCVLTVLCILIFVNRSTHIRNKHQNYYEDLAAFGELSPGASSGTLPCSQYSQQSSSDLCDKMQTSGCNNMAKTNARQMASNIAQKAAQEAKAANDAQISAAEAAAQQVKFQLAEKAMQSAKAAEAALAGKQQIVDQYEQDMREAECAVSEITSSLTHTQANAAVAAKAATEAINQLNDLKNLVKAATANLNNIESASIGAQQELTEKTQLLEAAKTRVETIHRLLGKARQDLDQTKQAAYKAVCAAAEAKQKAERTKRMSMLRKFTMGMENLKSDQQSNPIVSNNQPSNLDETEDDDRDQDEDIN